MADDTKARRIRADARGFWPGGVFELGEEPAADFIRDLTPWERIRLVHRLTMDAWALSGRKWPDYDRRDAPGRIVDLKDVR